MGGPIAQTYFGSMFRNGCKGLQSYILKARASSSGGRHEGRRRLWAALAAESRYQRWHN
jgi:hypothetical protein